MYIKGNTGEGAGFTFPPWGKLKGGKNFKRYVIGIMKRYM